MPGIGTPGSDGARRPKLQDAERMPEKAEPRPSPRDYRAGKAGRCSRKLTRRRRIDDVIRDLLDEQMRINRGGGFLHRSTALRIWDTRAASGCRSVGQPKTVAELVGVFTRPAGMGDNFV